MSKHGRLKDIQNLADYRGIGIQKVGIKDICLPMRVLTKGGASQIVHARCTLSVGLHPKLRGTHMSRMVEALVEWQKRNLTGSGLEDLLAGVMARLEAEFASVRISFDYFVEKSAPVSGLIAPTDLRCSFAGERNSAGRFQFTLGVTVPATTLCPCSKEISAYGAHNQRCRISAQVRYRTGCIWIEDLASAMEAHASSPVFPLLKREDEKQVTERAYEHPRFVEDVLRDCVTTLRELPDIEWFAIECESFESIHNHSAWASHEETVSAE